MDAEDGKDNVDKILHKISSFQSDIRSKQLEINEMGKNIKECKKVLFKMCDHVWEYDSQCGPYETIKYKCKKCKLWRDPYLYR